MTRFFILLCLTLLSQTVFAQGEKIFHPADYASLQECVSSASKWGVERKGMGIVLLEGKIYQVQSPIALASQVRIQGNVGEKKTVLNYIGEACRSDSDITGVFEIAAKNQNIDIRNIQFTRNTPGQGGGGFGGVFRMDVAVKAENPVSHVRILDCEIKDYSALYQSSNMAKWSQYIEIGRCKAENNHAYFVHVLTTKRMNFHDNQIEQIPVGDRWIHAGAIFRGVQDSQFVGNSLNLHGGGRAFNGLYFESMPPVPQFKGLSGASNVNLIIRGNRISHTKEEGILIERSRESEECCVGDVTDATPTTLVREANRGYGAKGLKKWTSNLWQDRTVAIVNGLGLGQVRQVVSNTETILAIDAPWEIIPDKTSVFAVMHHSNHILIEDNIVSDTGKASIAPYMCCGTTIKNNRLSLCRNHEWDTATIEMMFANVGGEFGDDDGTMWPNYNNVISGNRIDQDECMVGIRVGNTNFSSRLPGFRIGVSTYNTLIENNVIDMKAATNGPNKIVGGVTSFSGSVGIVAEAAKLSVLRKVVIRNNVVKNAKFGVWVGAQFESDNQGMLLDAIVGANRFESCANQVFISPGVFADAEFIRKNLVIKTLATASSTYDRNYAASYAVDGNSANSLWSSGDEKGKSPWLQLKLEEAKKIESIEIVTRQDYDQPQTRTNFEVRASNDPQFASFVVLGKQGATPLPYKSTWSAKVKSDKIFKYLRIAKTAPEYFTVAEVRLLSAK